MRRFALIPTINASTGLSHVALPKEIHANSHIFFRNAACNQPNACFGGRPDRRLAGR
jgi:hypothetical protein